MNHVSELRCVVCGQPSLAPASAGTCPTCQDGFAVFDVLYDMDRVRRTLTPESLRTRTRFHWRYAELLPIEPDAAAFSWPVGGSPLQETPRLADWLGVRRARVKDEGQNPTASFKDRASSVGVVHAVQGGATRIACASTGNAASSLAGYAARVGLDATIYVPRRAPDPKVAQLLVYGADVRKVRGTYAQAYDLCTRECDAQGWYNRNCAINPYLVEGKKTCGLEIAEQAANDPPDWVAVSVGDGCTIAGIVKGLQQMHELGFISRVPRVLGVQAEGMDPIARAFETGSLPEGFTGSTCADSIDVPVPRNWRKAVREVKACNGAFVRTSDSEITEAMLAAGRHAGIFAEPAAAATCSGVKRAVAEKIVAPGSDVLIVSTGSGLKDIATAMRVVGSPAEIDP